MTICILVNKPIDLCLAVIPDSLNQVTLITHCGKIRDLDFSYLLSETLGCLIFS